MQHFGLFAVILIAAFIESACASKPIKGFVSEGLPLYPIKKVILLKHPRLYTDVGEAVQKELRDRGVEIIKVEDFYSDKQVKSDAADSAIWVSAVKAFDIGVHIGFMEIRIYNAKTGELLGTAKLERSSDGTDEAVHELFDLIFSRIQQPL